MSEIYRRFGGENESLDYSDEAAMEMYLYESYGKGNLKKELGRTENQNGYAVGKK